MNSNNEYFVLKNQLDAETRDKLNDVPCVSSDTEKVFVIEWLNDGDGIVGFGCDVHGRALRLPMRLEPGLFVVTSDVPLLRTIMTLLGHDVVVYPDFHYRCNNFSPLDILMDYEVSQRPSVLAKIRTGTTTRAMELYYRLRKDSRAYRYAAVSLYWSVTNQVLFERMVKCNTNSIVPRVTQRWFDCDLNCYKHPEPVIPVITFDIETVSTDPNRVPTGEHKDDELFTVSIHHNHTNVLYTLVYLPLRNLTPAEMLETIRRDGYPEYADFTNVLEAFTTEKALLVRTLELLRLKDHRVHYLVGYNSLSYDMKYLFIRSAFYGISLDDFVYREGYSYGFAQIHLDLFRIIMAQYKFKNYGLSDVSKQLLKDTKTGVSAVQLRYTFHAMRRRQRFFMHEQCLKWPSVRDTLHYNNYDTILVSKLLRKTRAIDFTVNQAHECRIPLSSLNTNYNKMRYKLWSQCFVVGLGIGVFQSTFKSPIASIRYPLPKNDAIDIRLNLEDQLLGEACTNDLPYKYQMYNAVEKKKKYPGGANFCLGECLIDNVQMLDYRIAYPLLIDRKNISDETATILPASTIAAFFFSLSQEQASTFRVYDYLTHTGSSKSETVILYHQYIYNNLYCGGEFPFSYEELTRRKDSPVIMIWTGRRGILSDIITRFNTMREEIKSKRKTLDAVLLLVEEKINEVLQEKKEMESYENGTNDDAMDEESDNEKNVDDDEGDFGFESKSSDDADDDDEGDFGFESKSSNDADEDDEGDFGFESKSSTNEDDEGDFGFDDSTKGDNDDDDDGDFGFDQPATSNSSSRDDDDDGDFGFDQAATTRDSDACVTRTEPEKNATIDCNPFGFKCVNDYISIYENKTCVLNEALLRVETYDRQLEILEGIKSEASIERDSYGNQYLLKKSLVASIYGCLGISSPVCAALITEDIRSTLLQAAQFLVSLGYTVYYIDTDSLFVTHPTNTHDISPELNRRFPHTEIEMKVYKRCMFVQKKTYYTIEDGVLKYFQHVNGPSAWRDCIYYMYKQSHVTTNQDILGIFTRFYDRVYDQLQEHKTVSPELINLFAQDVKIKSYYKTNTHLSKLKEYLAKHHPTMAGSYKQRVYYHMDADVKVTKFRPTVDFVSVSQLRNVNMFKFYSNIFKTLFNVLKFHMKSNNAPYVTTIDAKSVLLAMIKAFLDVHKKRFPEAHITGDIVDEVSLNLEDFALPDENDFYIPE